jgi:hypothetical protein
MDEPELMKNVRELLTELCKTKYTNFDPRPIKLYGIG